MEDKDKVIKKALDCDIQIIAGLDGEAIHVQYQGNLPDLIFVLEKIRYDLIVELWKREKGNKNE